MSNNEFFQKLLEQTKRSFNNTPIYEKQKKSGKKWNYSVCGAPIQLRKGILMGVNWGADEDHEPQTTMPDGKDILTYPFIERSKYYLENYLHLDFDRINFNYVFFLATSHFVNIFLSTGKIVWTLRPKD